MQCSTQTVYSCAIEWAWWISQVRAKSISSVVGHWVRFPEFNTVNVKLSNGARVLPLFIVVRGSFCVTRERLLDLATRLRGLKKMAREFGNYKSPESPREGGENGDLKMFVRKMKQRSSGG